MLGTLVRRELFYTHESLIILWYPDCKDKEKKEGKMKKIMHGNWCIICAFSVLSMLEHPRQIGSLVGRTK